MGMAYQMLTGIHPFWVPGKDTKETAIRKIIDCHVAYPNNVWCSISPTGKDFIQKLLEPNPEMRLSANSALQHAWFASSSKCVTPLRPDVVHNLLKFQEYNKLKQAVLRLLAKELDELSIKDLRAQFEGADIHHAGTLGLEEIFTACEN